MVLSYITKPFKVLVIKYLMIYIPQPQWDKTRGEFECCPKKKQMTPWSKSSGKNVCMFPGVYQSYVSLPNIKHHVCGQWFLVRYIWQLLLLLRHHCPVIVRLCPMKTPHSCLSSSPIPLFCILYLIFALDDFPLVDPSSRPALGLLKNH